jgi:hypothetical protein
VPERGVRLKVIREGRSKLVDERGTSQRHEKLEKRAWKQKSASSALRLLQGQEGDGEALQRLDRGPASVPARRRRVTDRSQQWKAEQ